MAVSDGILFALGNPLLDIQTDTDLAFLEKYGLKANDAILAEEKHHGMYQELVDNYKVEYIPGGATQNAVRVAQWMLGHPNATSFVGCVGKDNFGKILAEKSTEAGVNVKYQITEKEPTGTCAVLITGKNRSLCAYLAAANLFSEDHLDTPEVRELLEKAKFYYISAFPLTVSPPSMLKIAKHACENNKLFSMNLSAPFLCQFFKEPMMQVMPYVDLLFGNETEALTFAKEQNFGTEDLKEIAAKISALPKENKSRSRTVIITQGAEPSIVHEDGKTVEYAIVPIKREDIVDTNGAGDAFVGGFLSQLVQGEKTARCIDAANYAANTIIQQSGCTYPPKPDFK